MLPWWGYIAKLKPAVKQYVNSGFFAKGLVWLPLSMIVNINETG